MWADPFTLYVALDFQVNTIYSWSILRVNIDGWMSPRKHLPLPPFSGDESRTCAFYFLDANRNTWLQRQRVWHQAVCISGRKRVPPSGFIAVLVLGWLLVHREQFQRSDPAPLITALVCVKTQAKQNKFFAWIFLGPLKRSRVLKLQYLHKRDLSLHYWYSMYSNSLLYVIWCSGARYCLPLKWSMLQDFNANVKFLIFVCAIL